LRHPPETSISLSTMSIWVSMKQKGPCVNKIFYRPQFDLKSQVQSFRKILALLLLRHK